jgi:hypothetical protein
MFRISFLYFKNDLHIFKKEKKTIFKLHKNAKPPFLYFEGQNHDHNFKDKNYDFNFEGQNFDLNFEGQNFYFDSKDKLLIIS